MSYFPIGYTYPYPHWILINISDYKLLPSQYRQDVQKLSKAIHAESILAHPNLEKQKKLFENFSKKYTMHIDLLRKWKKLETQGINQFDILLLEERETFINIKASQHFYDETFLNFSFTDKFELPVLNKVSSAFKFAEKSNENNINDYIREYRKNKAALSFPNPHLQDCWDYFQTNSLCPITPEMEENYQRLTKLWEKININKENPVQWIRYLQETNDHEFIVQNVEVSLAKMPFTKLAWKEYIAYLKRIDITEMLNVYSRYCHFFVDDWKMREMYRLEIVKLCHKQINVQHWINDYKYLNKELHIPLEYDTLFNFMVKNLITSIFNHIKSFTFNLSHIPLKKVLKKNEIKNSAGSEFPGFELHFIEYLIANANHRILTKFYSISKWFFKKSKIPLCHRLGICDNSKTLSFEHSFFISPTDLKHDGLKNIYVTHSIFVASKDSYALTKIIPILYKCDPKIVKIENQNLTFGEYCFLVNEENVEKIWFKNVSVQWNSGEKVPVEFLIERLPKAKCIEFEGNTEIDPETSKKLGEIQLLSKIEVFSLAEIDETFEFRGFSEFIHKNGTSSSKICLYFKPVVSATFKSNFKRSLRNAVDHWYPRYASLQQKPQLNIY